MTGPNNAKRAREKGRRRKGREKRKEDITQSRHFLFAALRDKTDYRRDRDGNEGSTHGDEDSRRYIETERETQINMETQQR